MSEASSLCLLHTYLLKEEEETGCSVNKANAPFKQIFDLSLQQQLFFLSDVCLMVLWSDLISLCVRREEDSYQKFIPFIGVSYHYLCFS